MRKETTMKKALVIGMMAGLVISCCLEAGAASGWATDFEKAAKAAKKSRKYMLLDFSGSDWCGWCVRLDKEVFSKAVFKKFGKKSLVLVMLDFPKHKPQSDKLKKQNRELMKKYGVRGFPTVILLSADGELVGKTGYRKGGPKKYIEHLRDLVKTYKAKVKKEAAKKESAKTK
jgi:thioredoxin-related protein